ncbi:MAG: diguanylate cyclase [bacterium]|nr:diguanylate cyclase [bacterium]
MTERGTETRPTILVVDDNSINLKLLEAVLSPEYLVRQAAGGAQALSAVETGDPPDLILLDVMMPEMDGFEVCRRLKANPKLRRCPVIFVTALDEETNEELGFNLGAVDYIAKPFSIPVVRARVRTHIALKKQADLLEQLSHVDALTQIANRRCFDKMFEQEWRRETRDRKSLSVLLIDIDHFKEYNDHYGHGAGDECLCRVASCLARSVARSGDLVARYGGEEFVVLLPDTDAKAAMGIAERMCSGIRALNIPHAYSSAAPCLTVSIGCATTDPAGADSPQRLTETADRMLYRSKAAGRNRVTQP